MTLLFKDALLAVTPLWGGGLIRETRLLEPTTSLQRQPEPTRALRARPTPMPPLVDGRLDDACWRRAEKADDFRALGTRVAPTQKTLAMVCFDEECVYVAFRCEDDDIALIKATKRGHDQRVWQDDCVEIFIDTNLDRVSSYHLGVNALQLSN